MTTGLEQRAHRLVELARAGDDPSAAQLLSLHGAVAARVAAQGAIAASGTTVTGKVTAAGALMKGLVVAGAIATGTIGFFALQSGAAPAPPVAVVPTAVSRPLPVARAAPPEPAAVAPPVVAAELPAASTHAAKAPSSLRLQDEAALLAEVQGALRSGQGNVALSKLESYDRRFPAGVLRAEADAARVFALCSAGRPDKARAAAARFAHLYPSSPAAARVQAACR
ncbi:MAG TPA: outer membrane protein assembly factor BamD [Polyangiaceae bacterium]|nr:outer membrane protein assembly factor BamD [Polyangiaceae bacterium]